MSEPISVPLPFLPWRASLTEKAQTTHLSYKQVGTPTLSTCVYEICSGSYGSCATQRVSGRAFLDTWCAIRSDCWVG